MKRGPKPRTAKNASQRTAGRIVHAKLEPTSALSVDGLREFQRLVAVLDNRGSLDRVDLAVVTECARVNEQIDQLYATPNLNEDGKEIPGLSKQSIQLITMLTSQRRGLLRELGLTIKPSNTMVKTVAKSSEPGSKWGDKLKIAGY